MQPKVTIVIPVYNVEQYLRQCLDSVVNQTMRAIQIICVNDGSPDGSRAILQEYADRDPRVEIIDKPNGGLSSARNAAYPAIGGKYVLFLDSDDWWALDLCEKTYQKAEETGAQMTFFNFQLEGLARFEPREFPPGDKTTVEEKVSLLDYPAACFKLWRTDFLLDNKLYFPVGLTCEDHLVHWQAITQANKISVVPERLYHYRQRTTSIMGTRKKKHMMDIVPIYNRIQEYLLESGYYTAYRDKFIETKLIIWRRVHIFLSVSLKREFAAKIRESLSTDDREFYRTAPQELIPKRIRWFYEMIDGGPIETVNYYVSLAIHVAAKTLKHCFPNRSSNRPSND